MNIPDGLKLLPPDWPDVSKLAREVAKLTDELKEHSEVSGSRGVMLPENVARALIALATNAWRIRVRLNDGNKEPREDLAKDDIKKINRYCDGMFESLSGIGMEIKDRTGEAFDYGLPEKVVTAQPQAGLSREIIIETIRPTIYWNSQIQPGEVVIGTPLEDDEPKQS